MTRDEKIHEAAFYKGDNLRRHGYTEIYIDAFTDGFCEGVSWADSTPNWHLCKDELPKPNVPVLALAKSHNEYYHYVGYYDDDDECWRADIDNQTIEVATEYWTDLPEPPKFD